MKKEMKKPEMEFLTVSLRDPIATSGPTVYTATLSGYKDKESGNMCVVFDDREYRDISELQEAFGYSNLGMNLYYRIGANPTDTSFTTLFGEDSKDTTASNTAKYVNGDYEWNSGLNKWIHQ